MEAWSEAVATANLEDEHVASWKMYLENYLDIKTFYSKHLENTVIPWSLSRGM